MHRFLFLLLFIFILVGPAWAEDADLQQTIADLTSQTNDKQRLDTHGAARIEISQIQTWLNEATNAIKEEKEEESRQLFELVRTQLGLVDQLILLAQINAELNKLEQSLSNVKKVVQRSQQMLLEKQAQIRAQKVMSK